MPNKTDAEPSGYGYVFNSLIGLVAADLTAVSSYVVGSSKDKELKNLILNYADRPPRSVNKYSEYFDFAAKWTSRFLSSGELEDADGPTFLLVSSLLVAAFGNSKLLLLILRSNFDDEALKQNFEESAKEDRLGNLKSLKKEKLATMAVLALVPDYLRKLSREFQKLESG